MALREEDVRIESQWAGDRLVLATATHLPSGSTVMHRASFEPGQYEISVDDLMGDLTELIEKPNPT